ncbi:tyrosine-protein phosphatase [Segniliparus rugosus]|nr:tyrosine-protein phosphatase [Segniliparus rugosus]
MTLEALDRAAPDRLSLTSVVNFRDAAGHPGPLVGFGGKALRPGQFYRSGTLDPDETEGAQLAGLPVSLVVDLRTTWEAERRPDRVPQGARYAHISVLGAGTQAEQAVYGHIPDPDEARESLRRLNRGFVTEAEQRDQFRAVFHAFAEAEGPVVFHCSYGKDRSGWTAAMLLSIAGVPESGIFADYLLSNEFLAEVNRVRLEQAHAQDGPEAANARAPIFEVHPDYLRTGLAQVERDYGTVDEYLRRGLGLDEQVLGRLRAKLLG